MGDRGGDGSTFGAARCFVSERDRGLGGRSKVSSRIRRHMDEVVSVDGWNNRSEDLSFQTSYTTLISGHMPVVDGLLT